MIKVRKQIIKMILEVTKIENGLNWSGEDRYFTNNLFESGLSYLLIDTINMSIELDNQIYGMCVETASIDGIMYSTSQEFANAIFG
jgi:hypothetical protein